MTFRPLSATVRRTIKRNHPIWTSFIYHTKTSKLSLETFLYRMGIYHFWETLTKKCLTCRFCKEIDDIYYENKGLLANKLCMVREFMITTAYKNTRCGYYELHPSEYADVVPIGKQFHVKVGGNDILL